MWAEKKRDWEKRVFFDFEGRTDGAEREGTTVQLGAANCRRPERAGMELPVLNDQSPMTVKGDPRP